MASWGFLPVLFQILQIQLKTAYNNMCVRRLDRRSENLKWEEKGMRLMGAMQTFVLVDAILASWGLVLPQLSQLYPVPLHPTPTSCVVPYFFSSWLLLIFQISA